MKFIKTELAKKLEAELLNQKIGASGSHTKKYPGLDFTPRRGTKGSAGFDLRACIEEPVTIFPDEVVKIPTGVKVWIGSDPIMKDLGSAVSLAGELLPRSSTAGAILNNTVGIVDSDYQGEVFIKLRNVTPEAITINTGEAFAQVLFKPVYIPSEMEEVTEFDSATERGEGGFGSTTPVNDDLLGRKDEYC